MIFKEEIRKMKVYIVLMILSFLVTAVITPVLIPILHKLKFGQTVRDDGPKTHLKKMGTPTMGGIAFLASMVILGVVYARYDARIMSLILVTLGFGIIGLIDDLIKIVKKRKDGLYPKQKMLGLILIATVFSVYITKIGVSTSIMIPFFNESVRINLAYLYIPFSILVLISATNAVNITDGLDGLATGITSIVMTFFMIYANKCHMDFVVAFCAIMIGGLLGFLIYNKSKAKVFMGDTGSLALGGALGAIALLMENPLLLIVVGGVYVIETLSVAIQVISFKTRGKRVFKMAPIHHHFELCGWKETKVVLVFWLASLVLCVIGYFAIR